MKMIDLKRVRYDEMDIAMIVAILLLFFTNISLGEVTFSSGASSVKVGGENDLVYNVRCWQEGREIISETNFEWSAQSTRAPSNEWLTFTGADGRKSQLMVMPLGTAVCQIYGRSKAR